MNIKLFIPFILVATLILPHAIYADTVISFSCCYTKNSLFISELLTSALKESSANATLSIVKCFPHLRKRHMLTHGDLDVLPLIQSEEYDRNLIPIPVPLTNGLISKRVLVVSKQKLHLLKGIKSLDQFRALNLVGAFGEKWFDNKIWDLNNLKYTTMAKWELIYPCLSAGNRNIDYFSRSVLEALAESRQHPELAIVPDLLFSYDKNIYLYLSPHSKELQPILTKALKQAQSSGLIDRLLEKYYGKDINDLELDKRTPIHLKTPQ